MCTCSAQVIFDAQTLAVVCRLRMPQRVPHGERGGQDRAVDVAF